MTDKLVTYADLVDLREMRDEADYGRIRRAPLLDRLIAAAEADQPPLPEGWVIYTDSVGVQRILWHEGGRFYNWSDCSHEFTIMANHRSLTPLRPTVTEEQYEAAVEAARKFSDGAAYPWRSLVNDVMDALGVVIAS